MTNLTDKRWEAIQLERQFPYWVTVYRANDHAKIPMRVIFQHLKPQSGHAKTIYRNPKTKARTIKVMLRTAALRDMMAEELHRTFPHISISDRPRR